MANVKLHIVQGAASQYAQRVEDSFKEAAGKIVLNFASHCFSWNNVKL